MADDPASTVVTSWSQGMNRALKAVEYMGIPIHNDLKGLVIHVSTNLTFHHDQSPFQVIAGLLG
jgi:hypothetical protein